MIRFQLALLGHSQRYLPAVLLYLWVGAVLFASNDGPALPGFAVTSGALLVVACWLTMTMVDAQDPVQRLITHSHAGVRFRHPLAAELLGVTAAVLGCCTALALLTEVVSTLTHGGYPISELGFGLLAHLACACAGLALGLPCSRLLVPRPGYGFVLAVGGVLLVLLVRVPPVNPMLRTMTSELPASAAILWGTAASVVALAVSATLVGVFVHRRR